jgi:hypothetical protein
MKKILLGLPFFLISCQGGYTIEPGDIVVKCVIDSLDVKPYVSTIEPYPIYTYYTDCGEKIVTRNNQVYHIGDTVTYVYKKKK